MQCKRYEKNQQNKWTEQQPRHVEKVDFVNTFCNELNKLHS